MIVCLFLIIVVLLQSGKAADLAGAFGGMGSQTVFGPRGSATVLSKATTIAAALFMVTSLTLSIMATRGGQRFVGDRCWIRSQRRRRRSRRRSSRSRARRCRSQVTPAVDGKQGAPQQINVPVVTRRPQAASRRHSEEVAFHLRRWRNWQTH